MSSTKINKKEKERKKKKYLLKSKICWAKSVCTKRKAIMKTGNFKSLKKEI